MCKENRKSLEITELFLIHIEISSIVFVNCNCDDVLDTWYMHRPTFLSLFLFFGVFLFPDSKQ
jgi:hypothetical protein